ncbi:MAG: SGNH/GDSL hydrolase family protein [Pseudomonadota bacterium]
MSRWAAALLSPLLIPQAAWVIARAARLPEAAGPREGHLGTGPRLRLLIIGDSSAAGVGVTHQDDALAGQLTRHLAQHYAVEWQLIAKTGATTASTLAHLRARRPTEADIAILIHGVNDTTRLVPTRRFIANQSAMVSLLNLDWNVPRTLICAVPPVGHFPLLPRPLRPLLGRHATGLGTALRQAFPHSHVPFDMPMDTSLMASDGFHPGPQVYADWARLLAARIKQIA